MQHGLGYMNSPSWKRIKSRISRQPQLGFYQNLSWGYQTKVKESFKWSKCVTRLWDERNFNANICNPSGPPQWYTWYPMAKSGTRQSPVDIVPTTCSPDNSLSDLKYQYTPAMIKLINTGSTWRMDFSPDGSNLSGGPLGDDYKVSSGLTRPDPLWLSSGPADARPLGGQAREG